MFGIDCPLLIDQYDFRYSRTMPTITRLRFDNICCIIVIRIILVPSLSLVFVFAIESVSESLRFARGYVMYKEF